MVLDDVGHITKMDGLLHLLRDEVLWTQKTQSYQTN